MNEITFLHHNYINFNGIIMKSRVLFILHEASLTGAPLIALHLGEALKREGISLSFALLAGGPVLNQFQGVSKTYCLFLNTRFFEQLDSYVAKLFGCKVRPLRFVKRLGLLVWLRLLNFQWVVGHTVGSAAFLKRIPAANKKILYVMEMSGTFDSYTSHPMISRLYEMGCKMIAISRLSMEDLNQYTQYPSLCTTVVPPPLFLNQRTGIPVANESSLGVNSAIPRDSRTIELVIGGCGSLTRRKGIQEFLDIIRHVHAGEPGLKLKAIWLGGTEHDLYRDSLKDYAMNLRIQDLVDFELQTTRVSDFYGRINLFLCTSLEEPYSLTCLEAASHGVPFMCWNRGIGAFEIIEDIGELVLEAYSPIHAAQQIIKLSRDPGKMVKLGMELKNRVGSFDLDCTAKVWRQRVFQDDTIT